MYFLAFGAFFTKSIRKRFHFQPIIQWIKAVLWIMNCYQIINDRTVPNERAFGWNIRHNLNKILSFIEMTPQSTNTAKESKIYPIIILISCIEHSFHLTPFICGMDIMNSRAPSTANWIKKNTLLYCHRIDSVGYVLLVWRWRKIIFVYDILCNMDGEQWRVDDAM